MLAVIIIGFSIILGYGHNDLIIPTYPMIIDFFDTSPAFFQYSCSINYLGTAIGSLIFGTISDYFNRKKILILCTIITVISLLGMANSSTIEWFFIWRFLEGFGISASATVCIAITFDILPLPKASSVVATYHGFITSTKAIFPLLGSTIGVIYSWQANIYFLAICFSVNLLLINLNINKTNTPKNNLNTYQIVKDFIYILSSKKVIFNCLSVALLSSSLAIFLNNMPDILNKNFNFSTMKISIYQSMIMGSFALTSFIYPILNSKLTPNSLKRLGIIFSLSGALTLLLASSNINLIIIGMCIFCVGDAIFITFAITNTVKLFPHNKGLVTSSIAFIRIICTSLSLALVGKIYNSTFKPILLIIFTYACLVAIMEILHSIYHQKAPVNV